MARKHHKPEEIVSKLRQVDVLVGQGTARVDAIRQVSITEQTDLPPETSLTLMLIAATSGMCQGTSAPRLLRSTILD